ncbi:carbohydrate kinase [Lichenihabitans sp. PAMC28606]|uniref:carbohydrate kinase family protein n=1 Tax=Lichenihabitans sp. PAMC28606 TaxID=2880932 RepID=UPI001D0B6654|nr:carbohydrate kinase [Lichenihabitans sp. PAMC28606]UDL95945.1 carbohydrate kinase [Lichenihabitans sp. PAMC28606]
MGDDLILVAGEALVDLIPLTGSSYEAVLGGSPFNTAIGLGRLGVSTGYAGRVSTDSMGEAIVERLDASSVDLGFVVRAPQPSPLAFVTRGTETTGARYAFYLGSTAYDGPSPFPDKWPGHVGHLHIGSFSATEGSLGKASLQAFAQAAGVATTSYDPNIRPLVIAPPEQTVVAVEARVRLSTVVKVSDEDLLWLYSNREPHEVAATWATFGPRLVVLTRGGAGAIAFFDGDSVERLAPTITVVDTVGAGDSFMAALLAAMFDDGAIGRRAIADTQAYRSNAVEGWVSFAIAAAAITCTRKGANPPTRDEMRAITPAGVASMPA